MAFAYDAADRKVSKSVDAAGDGTFEMVEYYVWDQDTPSGSDNVLFDFVDSDGPGAGAATLKTRYLLGDAVDQVLAQEDVPASEVLWLLQDNLGSVRETVKNDGTVNSRVDFDPFGNMVSIIDPSSGGAATTLKTRLNFTGQEWDADLRLVWYSDGTGPGRWYDPATGTFINQDALGFAAGDANLYRYVLGSPTNATDPSGMEPKLGAYIARLAAAGDIDGLRTLIASGGLSAAQLQSAQNAINRLESTAQKIISLECKGSILREFPRQGLPMRLADLKEAAANGEKWARTCLKLLTDKRFKKPSK